MSQPHEFKPGLTSPEPIPKSVLKFHNTSYNERSPTNEIECTEYDPDANPMTVLGKWLRPTINNRKPIPMNDRGKGWRQWLDSLGSLERVIKIGGTDEGNRYRMNQDWNV
ncbi:hypothetical protein DFH28DRAFT_1117985 [Melampsora americana]|nr:hypothetical protein DFH28DRAFT_1123133 [Melampsora americana]KAH9824189.1 hypothetical protein DFH28DRAFT_1117985 [Melampsora americana]